MENLRISLFYESFVMLFHDVYSVLLDALDAFFAGSLPFLSGLLLLLLLLLKLDHTKKGVCE